MVICEHLQQVYYLHVYKKKIVTQIRTYQKINYLNKTYFRFLLPFCTGVPSHVNKIDYVAKKKFIKLITIKKVINKSQKNHQKTCICSSRIESVYWSYISIFFLFGFQLNEPGTKHLRHRPEIIRYILDWVLDLLCVRPKLMNTLLELTYIYICGFCVCVF